MIAIDRFLKSLIFPIAKYGAETWSISKQAEQRINAFENKCYRRILRVPWTDKRTNESILNQLGVTRKLIKIINQRKLRYIGHAARNQKTDLMKVAYQGIIDAKRRRGRPTTTLLNNIKEVSGLDIYRIAWESEDRFSWRELVMSATTPNSDDRDGDR